MKNKNKKLFLFLALPISLAVFFIVPKILLAAEPSVIITKVYYNPPGSDNKTDPLSFESVILKNVSGSNVDLNTWEIRLGTYFSLSKMTAPVPPGKNITIYLGTGVDNNLDFKDTTETSLFLNKTGSQLGDKKGEASLYKSHSHTKDTLVDYVAYGDKSASTNYEQALLAKLWSADDFVPLVGEGCFIKLEEKTKNSSSDWSSSCPEKKKLDTDSIKISFDDEIYENIFADFEILGLDKDAKVVWTFGDGHKSYKQKTQHKYDTIGNYAASIKYPNGSQDILENFEVIVKKIPHPEVKIVAVNANPSGSDTKNETITLQNKSKKKINLNGWSIATGWKKLVNHPIIKDFEIKKDKEKEVTREFSKFTLNNKKSEVELRYPDGEVADSVKYNKKKEAVAEGEIYQKEKGKKWEWIITKKSKSSKTLSTNTVIKERAAPNSTNENAEIPENQIIAPEEPPEIKPEPEMITEETSEELIGKFSTGKNQKQIIEMKLLGFRDPRANPKFTQKLASLDQGFVLGISTIKNTRPKINEATSSYSLKKYFYRINLSLNNFLLKFSD